MTSRVVARIFAGGPHWEWAKRSGVRYGDFAATAALKSKGMERIDTTRSVGGSRPPAGDCFPDIFASPSNVSSWPRPA